MSTTEKMILPVVLLRQRQVARRSDTGRFGVGVDHRARRAREVVAKLETTSMEVT